MRSGILIAVIAVSICACANERPALYQNELVRRIGAPAAEQEINTCMIRTEEYIGKAKRGEVIFEENVTGSRGLSGGPAFDLNLKENSTPILSCSRQPMFAREGIRATGVEVMSCIKKGRHFCLPSRVV